MPGRKAVVIIAKSDGGSAQLGISAKIRKARQTDILANRAATKAAARRDAGRSLEEDWIDVTNADNGAITDSLIVQHDTIRPRDEEGLDIAAQ